MKSIISFFTSNFGLKVLALILATDLQTRQKRQIRHPRNAATAHSLV